MTRKFELTIGADPEFFVYTPDKDGLSADPMIACGKFGGAKGAPILLTDKGGFLEDGVTIEFNLIPAKSLKEMQKTVFDLVSEFEKQKNVKVAYHSSCSFKLDELKKHPEAMAIGCAPDRYAYGLRSTPSVAQFKSRRFAGGHIHLGIDTWPEGLEKVNVVRYLDIQCLIPFMHHFHDVNRYQHYGFPGLYRETSYGIEWRSPDNTWCNPRFFERPASRDARSHMNAFMERFDSITELMMRVLNKDGDGVRFNETIESFVKAHNLADHLSSQPARRKCGFPSGVRNAYGNLTTNVQALLELTPKKKKLKPIPDMAVDDVFDNLVGGTEA